MQHKYHQIHLFQKPNNHGVLLEQTGFPEVAHALIDVLNNHFLNTALTKIREDVPSTYLMQFWLSANVEEIDNHGVCITGYASHRDAEQIALLSFNKAKLRAALSLPSKRDLNLLGYSENPTDEEICEFVNFLGYNQPLSSRTQFRRGRLPPLWNTLFSILNRALTCKTGSPDQSSHQILAIMYGIYYDLPLDYAGLIFEEMVNAVKAKVKEQTGSKKTKKEGKNPKNLSYPRFFSILFGDDLFGEAETKGKPFPKDGLPAKINRMKSHSPTLHSEGYSFRRPLSMGMLNYLSESERELYIRGYRTPEPEPATPHA
jgi:hypothetical protein